MAASLARSAPTSSFGMRFRSASAPIQKARTVASVIDIARPPSGRAAPLAKPTGRPQQLMVPTRTAKSDSAGAVISGALPSAAMLLGARVVDRSKLGQAVKDFTGVAELSDVAAAGAILLRATGVDAGMPGLRANGTRLIVGKMHEWALRMGDFGSDVMTDWSTYNEKKAKANGEAAEKAKAASTASAKTQAVTAEAVANP